MQLYPARTLERAMKIKEVITRAMMGLSTRSGPLLII